MNLTKIIVVLSILPLPVSSAVIIDYVPVGGAGNSADVTGFGSVSYDYNIGKYEVTNAQYVEFLNAKGASNEAGIYDPYMGSTGIRQSGSPGDFSYSLVGGFESRPVVYVSFYDAARFANWIANGQGSGDMEDGSYTLNGATSGLVQANPGASIRLPTENEWYKTAYYDAQMESYFSYATGRDSIGLSEANYGNQIGHPVDVGTYSSVSGYFGTFDMAGNVWEWNEALISPNTRGLRGGSALTFGAALISTTRMDVDAASSNQAVGFRLVSVVPEPGAICLSALACGSSLVRRKR
jgi:formylglycine-generating enzyme